MGRTSWLHRLASRVSQPLLGVNSRHRRSRRRLHLAESLEQRVVMSATSYIPAYVLDAPLSGVSSGLLSFPTFGDVDSDGDQDLVIGRPGSVDYFENVGNATAPDFVQRAGVANPFAAVSGTMSPYDFPNPTLADWDGDGDLDLALGLSSTVSAYENIGTAATPSYQFLSGVDNPFGGVSLVPLFNVSITFGDLDGDADLDAVLGSDLFSQTLYYLENQSGAFVPQSGVDSPLSETFVGLLTTAELSDLEGDGDLDLVVAADNNLKFYENTGTSVSPEFGFIPASGTILGEITSTSSVAPAFADLDGDGDQDLLLSHLIGTQAFYRASGDSANAPVNTIPYNTVQTVEDTTLVLSSANASGIAISDANADISPLQVQLTASHGTLSLATNAGITFLAGDGLRDGTLTIEGTLNDLNIALDGLQFHPELNYSGLAEIVIRTNDLGQPDGGVGLIDIDRVQISVISVAQAVADLRLWVTLFVGYGEFTAGQGSALLKQLELTGSVDKDVKRLQSYLHIARAWVRNGIIPSGWESVFVGLAEGAITGLQTQ